LTGPPPEQRPRVGDTRWRTCARWSTVTEHVEVLTLLERP
jgi:hypothetical protein